MLELLLRCAGLPASPPKLYFIYTHEKRKNIYIYLKRLKEKGTSDAAAATAAVLVGFRPAVCSSSVYKMRSAVLLLLC
jgi:hypothetical protein